MSERYANCSHCLGRGTVILKSKENVRYASECGTCGGTGFSGDVMDKVEQEAKTDWEKNKPADMNWGKRGLRE